MVLNFLKHVTGVSGGRSKYVFGFNLMKYKLHKIEQFHCIRTKMGKCQILALLAVMNEPVNQISKVASVFI